MILCIQNPRLVYWIDINKYGEYSFNQDVK